MGDALDVNDLTQLRALIEDLRRAGVRAFEHPSGLKLTIDTRALPAQVIPVAHVEGEF